MPTIPWSLLADLVLILHLAFIAFVLLGAVACLQRPRLAWLHLPAVLWSIWVNLAGWTCPLTPLEIALRRAAGEGFYTGSFIAHYFAPLVYPPGMRPGSEAVYVIAAGMLAWNVALYGLIAWKARGSIGRDEDR